MDKCMKLSSIKDNLVPDLQNLLVTIFESQRKDMAQLLKDMAVLKKNDNFEISKMRK